MVFSIQLAPRRNDRLIPVTPLVSTVIPCHNARRWLSTALDSAIGQSWPRHEIIVVDDGSTDDSLAIARSYESRGVRVLGQSNRGASAARNAGLRNARGDFVQFLDADDLLATNKISLQVATLQSANADVLAAGEWGRFTTDPRTAAFHEEAVYRAANGVEFLQLHYETGSMMQPGAWLVPRELLNRAGPWDETLSLNDDGEFFARVMLAASRIIFVRGARVYYRSGDGATLSGRKDRRALDSLFRSVELTTSHLHAADQSPRTTAAIAHAWKWTSRELYPGAPDLSRLAEARSHSFGGSSRSIPCNRVQRLAGQLLGWRFAARLFKR